jgi:uncharacterized protein YuzE
MKRKHDFDVTVEVENATGEVLAVYFRVRKGKSALTKEYARGNVFVDYDSAGQLLGIEMLGPCRISILDKITSNEPEARRFVKRAIPRQMAVA